MPESGGDNNSRVAEVMDLLKRIGNAELNEKDGPFVAGMRDRIAKFGVKTIVSPGQLFWLRDAYGRVLEQG